jgi:hypothetical protein
MQYGTVQKLISIFNQSFHQLGANVSLEKLEALSVTIHRAMTVQTRHFHTLEHVFNFVDPNNAIVSLAAMYHDIVYYQVDMGFSPQIMELISPYIRQEHETFFVKENIPVSDRMFYISLELFDLRPGQNLSASLRMNEFLSALVMYKELDGLVSEKDLVLMNLCIEATIPFRAVTPDGKNHFDEMEIRLANVIQRYHLDINQDGLDAGIKMAVAFANKDIENFAETEPGRFLENTWNLLPETNFALRFPDVYSISAYRQAMQKMEKFFDNLNVNTVFSRYHGVPSEDEYAEMVRLAQKNIQIAREYLRIKILVITILEALAQATGGDAPLSLFMGDIPREGVSIKRIEYYLPELEDPDWADRNSTLYQLFESGRPSEASFDMKNSPLALFVYKALTPEKIAQSMKLAHAFYAGEMAPEDYLKAIDPLVVQPIARACSIMVFTRRQALLAFAGEDL